MEFDSDIRVHRAVSLHAKEKGRSIKRPFLMVWVSGGLQGIAGSPARGTRWKRTCIER